MAEVPTLDEFTATSDMPYVSDCDWTHLEPAKPVISPMPSPGPPHHDAIRNGRSRASPTQHNTMRTSPYTLESNRTKRWSTGTYASNSPQLYPMHQFNSRGSFYGSPLNPQHSLPPTTTEMPSNFHNQVQNLLYSQPTLQTPSTTILSSPDQQFTEASRPIHSQGLFRLLQSNADRLGGYSSHFVELSSPPDLYVSLHDEPSNPPESDMNTSDPNLVPHEQDLRFTGDLYTPKWVRGHGNKREGWCGLCKPGRWLVLKNSAFWYDKSFTHGVSAATGSAFQGPQDTRRTEGNLDVWEGLCGSCGDWIPLVSSKKKGTTWFRHAYKVSENCSCRLFLGALLIIGVFECNSATLIPRSKMALSAGVKQATRYARGRRALHQPLVLRPPHHHCQSDKVPLKQYRPLNLRPIARKVVRMTRESRRSRLCLNFRKHHSRRRR